MCAVPYFGSFMKEITCIICAYNEAPRIGAVLKAVSNCPILNEVIVVDDGSTDDTAKAAKKFPNVRVISYSPNQGKTHALMTGIASAKTDLVMMIDADLAHLTPKNITDLAGPVLAGEAGMSISLRKNSLLLFKLIGLDFVSGERVFSKSILRDVSAIKKLPPFGIEAYINERIIAKKERIAVVRWNNVGHLRKMSKVGWLRGRLGELSTALDVIKVLSLSRIVRQNRAMLALAHKFAGTKSEMKASTEESHE